MSTQTTTTVVIIPLPFPAPPPPPPVSPGICLHCSSRVTMVDGTTVRIDELKVGDAVLGMWGQPAVITNIGHHPWPSTDFYSVSDQKTGNKLLLTFNHSVWDKEANDWAVPNLASWIEHCVNEPGGNNHDGDVEVLPYWHPTLIGRVDGWSQVVPVPEEVHDGMDVYGLCFGSSNSGFFAEGFLVEACEWEFADYRGRTWMPPLLKDVGGDNG